MGEVGGKKLNGSEVSGETQSLCKRCVMFPAHGHLVRQEEDAHWYSGLLLP